MNNEVNIDFLGKGQAQGDVALQLQANGRLDPGRWRPFIGRDGKSYISIYKGSGDPKKPESYHTVALNNNAGTLRPDEWKQLDAAILPAAQTRLQGIADLKARGLTYNLGNGMGTTVLESHTVSDAFEAELTMDAITRSKGDRPVFGTTYLPIPIIHVDYSINARVLAASRSLGNPLDTTSAELAARKVAEKLEAMLFTATSYTFGGGTIYSYLNAPNKNAVTITTGTWTSSGKTGAEIVADVLAMKQASINDRFYGPWVLYLPSAVETVLDTDYDATTPGTTIRERILKIAGITDVKIVDTLTSGYAVLVQMTSDVIRLVTGMEITNVQWSSEGNMITNYKVMAIQVPQIRSDYNSRCGIVVAATI